MAPTMIVFYSWCEMREPRGEGGETGKGKLVRESFIHEVDA